MSKFLSRIAPQDEVLLEADIGTMIPSAEQLAEERVTRFNADKEIRLRVKALEESGSAIEEAKAAAEQASKAAQQASKAAQQAEDAKNAIGDVGGRLDKVDDKLSQIPISQSITYRDVMGELQKAMGWTDSIAKAYTIKRIVTTKNGNLVLIAQSVNTAFAIYVLSTKGDVLASQSLPNNLALYLNTNTHLLEYNEEIIVLTDATCYKIVDTDTNAMISAIGTIDFNGLTTKLPYLYDASAKPKETAVLTIGDRAIIADKVIDLTNLKVIQSLSAYPIFVYGYTHSEADTAIVTLSNGNVAYLAVGEDGLISVTDDKVHKNIYFVTGNSSYDVYGWLKPLGTGSCDFLMMRKNSSDVFASTKCLEFFKGNIISRGNNLCGLTNDGRIAVVKTSATVASNGASPNYHFAECEMSSFFRGYRIIGVDPRGAWFLSKAVSVWAGFRPTAPLVRVNF